MAVEVVDAVTHHVLRSFALPALPEVATPGMRGSDAGLVVRAVAMLADNVRVAAALSNGCTVVLHLTDAAAAPVLLQTHRHCWMRCIAPSLDGQLLALSGSAPEVAVVRVGDWSRVATLRHADDVFAVAFNPQCTLLASGSHDGTLVLTRVGTWQIQQRIATRERCYSVRFFPEAEHLVLAGLGDGRVVTYNVGTGLATQQVQAHEHGSPVRCMDLSTNGRVLLTASIDATCKLIDWSSGEVLRVFEHKKAVYAATLLGDLVLTASGRNGVDGCFACWNAHSGLLVQQTQTRHAACYGVAAPHALPWDFLGSLRQRCVHVASQCAPGAQLNWSALPAHLTDEIQQLRARPPLKCLKLPPLRHAAPVASGTAQ
eukprot:TRINITY_DN14805_c0_g1_i1.p1 TRINITY_DN14805_c0_g1~~TRINITY_DN14805_c0_g1_i1.p1  ORF type:complete len:384 (+),score=107.30 TRINITY_DN14805_c0_g1_i1:37-1152(+)